MAASRRMRRRADPSMELHELLGQMVLPGAPAYLLNFCGEPDDRRTAMRISGPIPACRTCCVLVLALALGACDKAVPEQKADPNRRQAASAPSSGPAVAHLRDALGIRTTAGEFTQLIPAGAALPVSWSDVFGNATDNQPAVEIALAQMNDKVPVQVANIVIDKLPPSPKGKLQIAVQIRIDETKQLRVKASIAAQGFEREYGPFSVE